MKAFLLAALLGLVLPPATALANTPAPMETPPPTEIVVSGSGSMTFPPDVAMVSATIQTNSANASDAVSRNNVIYERVVAGLTKLGIARADVSLAGYTVNYNPKPLKPEADTVYGYSVSRDFSVKVRDITKAGAVVDACSHAGATSIGGVTFGLNDSQPGQAQATTKAVDDARAKAQALAVASHLRIIGIQSISLSNDAPMAPMSRMSLNAAPAGTPTQLDASSVSVTVTVQITFLAQP
jgi:uncharacterized protein YggE